MNKIEKDIKLLKECEDHYKRMIGFTSVKEFRRESPESEYCPLCREYAKRDMIESELCSKCPIALQGHEDCSGTPWRVASHVVDLFQDDLVSLEVVTDALKKEKDYLTSVREGLQIKMMAAHGET